MKGGRDAIARNPKDGHRIAVLPLANISLDARDEYFTDGMTEELISTLSRIVGLRVIARTSVMRFKGASKSIVDIGKELRVATILEGSVRKAGDKIRIAVQLIDTASEEHLWAEVYDRNLEDIFAIQSDIAQRVAEALKVRILQEETLGIERRATNKLEGYALYLRGRHFLNSRTKDGLNAAVESFQQALDQDPSYALAYTGLADAYAVLALLEWLPPRDAFPQARAAAEKALELDDSLAEANTSLGIVKFQFEWDWTGCERAFRRAIELSPSYAAAHQFYADFLKAMGRFDEAVAEMQRAHELDPLSLAINTGLGHVFYLSRQYDRAIEQYQAAVRLDPTFVPARLWFGRPYLQKGMFKEAVAELEQAVALSEGSTISIAMLGHACASAGQSHKALELLETLKRRSTQQYVPSYWIALVYVGLGDKGQAFAWLERAVQERSSWLVWIGVEPRYDSIRSDPRFASLVARLRFSDRLGTRTANEEEIQRLLSSMDRVELSRFRVVGNYMRFEESARNRLKDLKQKLVAGLESTALTQENYLIWAPPGSGKTFFARQMSEFLKQRVRYHEANLANLDERSFRAILSEVGGANAPALFFVDEVDSKPNEPWPYEALLVDLEATPRHGGRTTFILAGSSGKSIAEMKGTIASRPKGSDLLSRVPHGNEYEISAMTAGDRILVAVATLRHASREAGREVAEIEKLALYYVATNPHVESARQLREFALMALARMPLGEDRLKYDHLFEPGDPQSKEFWIRARASAPTLINSYAPIED